MNARQWQIYHSLRNTHPESESTGLGQAFWHGYKNHDLPVEKAGPRVGLSGYDARAAYKAGQDQYEQDVKELGFTLKP